MTLLKKIYSIFRLSVFLYFYVFISTRNVRAQNIGAFDFAPNVTITMDQMNNQLVSTITNQPTNLDSNHHLIYEYRWYRNFGYRIGEDLGKTDSTISLSDPDVSEGDVWFVRVRAIISDTLNTASVDDDSVLYQSDYSFSNKIVIGVFIPNDNPPSNPSVTISPINPQSRADNIKCIASNIVDPDGDAFSVDFKWFEFNLNTNALDPLLNENGKQFSQEVIFAEETASLTGKFIICEVTAIDSFGNASDTTRSFHITIASADDSSGSENTTNGDEFEPDNSIATARPIYLNTDVQHHDLREDSDNQDWIKFRLKMHSVVSIYTGNNEMVIEQIQTNSDLLGQGTLHADTFLQLFKSSNTVSAIYLNDNTGFIGRSDFTLSAKIVDVELEPGVYYLRITQGGIGEQIQNYSIKVVQENLVTTPNKPQITPLSPTVLDDITAAAIGMSNEFSLKFTWFLNGHLLLENSDFLSRFITKAGDQLKVAVIAINHEGVESDPVTILGIDFNLDINITKTLLSSSSPVSSTVSIGWFYGATSGFDQSVDVSQVAVPSNSVGSLNYSGSQIRLNLEYSVLPMGSFVSEGIDSNFAFLTADKRPFDTQTSWYIYVDLREGLSNVVLTWGDINLPVDRPITLIEVDPDNNFSPISELTIDMKATKQIDLDLTRDNSEVRVYLVSLGENLATIKLRLKNGWNLISIPFTPHVPDIDTVFKDVKNIEVWEFHKLKFEKSEQIVGRKGYWIYYDGASADVMVRGKPESTSGEISLSNQWNLIGIAMSPPFNPIPLPISQTILRGGSISQESIWHWEGNSFVKSRTELECGEGYWVFSKE